MTPLLRKPRGDRLTMQKLGESARSVSYGTALSLTHLPSPYPQAGDNDDDAPRYLERKVEDALRQLEEQSDDPS
ncbi:MAG: hypothetical protein VKJ64_03005 [Leptolyngbyaceae bacterium]|nr:hypothetical protein [Leptolyngbyaceae bacterium]